MRRPAVLLSIALLAALMLARRRRRAAPAPLVVARPAPALPPPAPGMRFLSVPWELVAAPADEPSLTIRYAGDEHMELDRVDARETPTQVFLTVLTRWQAPGGGWFAFERRHEAAVALAQPLGGRALVHAPVDEPGRAPLYP
ncbi:MAG TPA: hypothetical protein VF250_09810 [Conexibacter sp.]